LAPIGRPLNVGTRSVGAMVTRFDRRCAAWWSRLSRTRASYETTTTRPGWRSWASIAAEADLRHRPSALSTVTWRRGLLETTCTSRRGSVRWRRASPPDSRRRIAPPGEVEDEPRNEAGHDLLRPGVQVVVVQPSVEVGGDSSSPGRRARCSRSHSRSRIRRSSAGAGARRGTALAPPLVSRSTDPAVGTSRCAPRATSRTKLSGRSRSMGGQCLLSLGYPISMSRGCA
jgi:hypothetical protein